jgi:hypothetical protein
VRKLLFVLGAAVCASACFAVTDDVSGIHGPPPGLTMRFDGMDQHTGQLFDFKIIDKKNFVQMHGKVLPLRMTHGQFKLFVPRAIPDGATGYRLDFWANEVDFDPDHTGKINVYEFDHDWPFPNQDHSWRVSLDDNVPSDSDATVTHANGSYDVAFSHYFTFVDLNEFPDYQRPKNPPKDTTADAVVQIANLSAALEGKLAEVRVANTMGRVVGLFRFTTTSAPVEWRIEGCIERGNIYDVDLYIDANGNNDANGGGYDAPSKGPGNDLGWRLARQQAGDTELRVTFDAADTAHGNVDVGEP